ncbi:MAG: hypothetical protein ACI4RK_02955, partial [Oscillospiraceae bacterium]
MSENKRRFTKKSAAMFAFAATLLAANAVSVVAAAEGTSGSDFVQNPELTDAKYTGSGSAYNKITDNVFTATNKSQAVADYYKALNDIKDFGLYAKTVSSNHLEANSAVGKINSVEQNYTNVVAYGSNMGGNFVTYFDSAPTQGTTIKFANLASDTKFELVLGFDFELSYTDNGNRVGFKAGGVQYEILDIKAENITIRRATPEEQKYNITGTLDKIGAAGGELISAVEKSTGVNVGQTLDDAYNAIKNGGVA